MKFIILFALIAVAVADPKPQILSATPLLAKIAGPEAPASTDHAAHVAAPIVAAYSAPVVASYSAPLAYNAFASPLAYNERYVYPSPYLYPAPVEKYGYRYAY